MVDNRRGEGMAHKGSPSGPNNQHQKCLELVYEHIRRTYPDVNSDDLAQDTIEFVLRRGHTLDSSRTTIKALKSTADRLARAARRAHQSDADNRHRAYFPAEIAGADERAMERGRLCRAWQMLATSKRELLMALIYDGVTPRQEAEQLGISYDATRKRKERARSDFEKYYKGLGVLIPAWFALKSVAQRAFESPVSAFAAKSASVVGLVTAGLVGVSMWSADPGRDHDSHLHGLQRGDVSMSGPASGLRHSRPPAPTAPQSTVSTPRAPSTPAPGTNAESAPSALPAHVDVHVNPDTAKGAKQAHAITADTPMGPIAITGRSQATDRATGATVCDRTLTTCPADQAETQRVAPDEHTHSASPSRGEDDAIGDYPRRGTMTGAG